MLNLNVVDVFTKYAWVEHLGGKKAKTVLNGFIKIENESKRNPNKLWVGQGRWFYKKSMQKLLDDNDTLMHLTYDEGKSVVAERFIRTLKEK